MKIVITFGTYDLFHIGHLNILERARALGDKLVVGVSTDELNLSKKGLAPIFPLSSRLKIIQGLKYVDQVFPEESLELKAHYIDHYGASILVMGDDWQGKFDHLKSHCSVVYLPRTEGISTTAIKDYMTRMGPKSL